MCLGANPRLVVRRARFSALIATELHRAVNNLVSSVALHDSGCITPGTSCVIGHM